MRPSVACQWRVRILTTATALDTPRVIHLLRGLLAMAYHHDQQADDVCPEVR